MKRTALSLIAGGVLAAGFAGQASATSPNSGCPPSYTVWIVGSTPPYHADSLVNRNGDNEVCAMQLDDKTFVYEGSTYPGLDGNTYPLYNFIDNDAATHDAATP
jgi:hypothetical protein